MLGPNASADALLTEHLRYTPLSLIDDIINTINAIVYRALTAVETGLLRTSPHQLGFGPPSAQANDENAQQQAAETSRAEIENGVHQLETLLEATVDKTFDIFEIWTLRNVLKIPDGLDKWIRLAHYENLTLPLPSTAPTPTSIQTLRQSLHASQTLSLALEAEHASTTSLLCTLHTLTSTQTIKPDPSSTHTHPTTSSAPLSFLPTSQHSTPLSTSAQFTTSQLPALRSLLSELRPKLSSLNGLVENEDALRQRLDWEAPKEERRAYVEGEARRAVRGEMGTVEGSGGDKGELGAGREQSGVEAMEGIVERGSLRDEE